jgi:uncharacterized membrane protein HdeD (DUF308 family)
MPGSTFLIIRGLLGLVIGMLAFLWPGLTIAVLVGIFAAYALIDGIANLMMGLTRSTRQGRSWALVAGGLVGIAAAVLMFLWPGITALAVVLFIAAWAVITGVFEIAAAIRLRRLIEGEWLMILSGAMSIIFGALVFMSPAAGAIGIAWLLGAYAAATGIVLIALGVRLRSRETAFA